MSGALFTTAQYLAPLETSGCVGPRTGWSPVALALPGESRAPCYRKTHSWGEFVFDFEFAAAYERHGLSYYPKLVCCVPFTPVPGPRLLAADDDARRSLAMAMMERRGSESSAHILFLLPGELELLRLLGWLPRLQLRYGWSNAGYASFEDFLSRLSSKKRKNMRQERAQVAASGVEIQWCEGTALSQGEWRRVYELYASTYQVRGQRPYLNLQCLQGWAANLGPAMQFCLARRQGSIVAMAFYFRESDTLYGRHWGGDADERGLHFELCCYQGVQHCIDNGLQQFDAGVQGEHRLQRGFEPAFTYSAHWFAHEGFRAAIGEALEQESRLLHARMQLLREHTAFRKSDPV